MSAAGLFWDSEDGSWATDVNDIIPESVSTKMAEIDA